jgi:hypothetical protein
MSRDGDAYIMPAEQLLDLMSARFSRFKTVLLSESTRLIGAEGDNNPAMTFEEQVWIKSPGSSGSQIAPEIEGQGMSVEDIKTLRLDVDTAYRQLLVSNSPQHLSTLLLEWGIDLASVSLTRLDGDIAYCIGERPKEGPRLLVEKERFLPLLVSYRAVYGKETRIVQVRFKDYRKVEKGWFPFRIDYFLDGDPVESYLVLKAEFNVPLPPPADTR